MCRDCLNERNAREYWNDPELWRQKAKKKYKPEYAAKYYKENKEKINARNAKWRADNAEKVSAIGERYRIENRDYVLASKRAWAKRNPEAIKAKENARRALEISAEGRYCKADVLQKLEAQDFKCVYCFCELMDVSYHVDHIMPLSLGGSNWPDNIQCLCPTCNLRKGAKHPDDWHKEIGYDSIDGGGL